MEQIEKQFDDDGRERFLDLFANKRENICFCAFSLDILLKRFEQLHDLHGYFSYVSSHEELSIEIITSNPHIEWSWFYVSSNPNFTIESIIKHLDLPWNWNRISCSSPHITMEIMENNIFLPWNFHYLSFNSNLSPKIILQYPDKLWNWNGLSENQPMEFILQHPELPWNWEFISKNSHLKCNHIAENLDKPWNWHKIADRFMRVPIDMVAKHPNANWQIKHPSFILNYSFYEIMCYPNLSWNWGFIFQHFIDEFAETHKQQNMKWILLVTMFEHYQILHETQMQQPLVYENFEHIVMNDYLLMKLLKY